MEAEYSSEILINFYHILQDIAPKETATFRIYDNLKWRHGCVGIKVSTPKFNKYLYLKYQNCLTNT